MSCRFLASGVIFTLLILCVGAGAKPRRPPGTPAHAAALGGSVLAPTREAALPDPLPFQRIFLPPERLDTLNAEIAGGKLKKLDKSEFEALVQTAARVQDSAGNPARILEATYKATVQSGRVTGSGEWLLGHPTPAPSAMAIEPLPGAIQTPKWSDGRPPLLFRSAPEGKPKGTTYLWVEDPSQNRFAFQWSVRSVEQPDEERCTLRFPRSPIAWLELTVPSDRVPVMAEVGALLTGPFPATKGEDRLWKLAFGGLTQLELAFRKVQATEESNSAVVAIRTATWNLRRGEALGQFDFALQAFRQGTRQRVFHIDAGLQIATVTGESVDGWEVGQEAPQGRSLTIRLRDEAPTTRITIGVSAAMPTAAASWSPPHIRIHRGLLLGDSIAVQLGADVKLEGWQPGDYRLGSTSTTPVRTTKLEFVPTLLNSEDRAERRAPTIRFRTLDRAFDTVESLEWRLEPSRTKLTATFGVTVVRGPIPNFAFQTSGGYILESVALTPDDPGATFGPQPGVPNGWLVEPTRAAATGQALEIRLEFRAVESPLAVQVAQVDPGKFVSLPKVVPTGAGDRSGIWIVRPSAGMMVSTAGLSAVQMPLTGEPGFSISYRGREPEIDVLVARATPSITADLEIGLRANAVGWRMTTALKCRVEGVPVQSILVWVPGFDPVWQIEPAAGATRVPGDAIIPWLHRLGTDHRWSVLAHAGMPSPPVGSIWRIAFAKPISGDFNCSVETDVIRSEPGAGVRILPVPHFLGVPITDVAVDLDPASARNFRAIPQRTPTDFPPRVTLAPRNIEPFATAPAIGSWVFRDVRLHSRVEFDRVCCRLRGTVVEAGGPRLPIALGEVRLESTTVDGKDLTLTVEEVGKLGLPIHHRGSEFEVGFTRPLSPGLRSDIAPHTIGLPGEPAIERSWSPGPNARAWPTLDAGMLTDDGSELAFVASRTIRAGGLSVAFLLAIAFTAAQLLRRWRLGSGVAVFAAVGLGIASWLAPPGWSEAIRPALAVAFAGVAVSFALLHTRALAKPANAVVFGAIALGGAGQAQAPDVAKVYVFATPKSEPGEYKVLAPKTLLDKLDALARSPLPDAAILSADYDCTAKGDSVDVTAKYQIHSQKAGEQTVALPLSGVRLSKATLDGREAFPDAGAPDRFQIPIRGSGSHELIVQFSVPVQSAGTDRDVKFSAPDVPVSRVGFAAGLRGRQLDVPSRAGGQALRIGVDGLRVEAEHGMGRAIHLHWRDSGTAEGAKPIIGVKEGAVWDLGEAAGALTAAWQYRVDGGTVAALKIEWPAHVLPDRVTLESADGAAGGPGIRSWKLGPAADGFAPLDIRLQSPAEGRFTLVVKGDSTRLPSAKPVLVFPRSADVPEPDRDSFYAVRFAGIKSESVGVSGAIDYPADAVTREFPKLSEFNFVKSPPARVVRRASGKATELRPNLVPIAAYQPIAGEVVYKLGRRIAVEGAMRANSKDSGSVEFDVPAGLLLHDVRSPNLAGWTRIGSRIQAWLTQPAADVIIRWSGQLPDTLTGETVVDLPPPRWPSAVARFAEPPVVRVRPAPGWMIQPLPVDGLKAKLSSGTEEWVVSSDKEPTPPAKFVARPIPKPGPLRGRPKSSAPVEIPSKSSPGFAESVTEAPTPGDSTPVRTASWIVGIALAIALLSIGGRQMRPELFALSGIGAVAVFGAESGLSAPFWLLAGLGIVWRIGRIARRAFG